MGWIAVGLRILVGAAFVFFGLTFFVKIMDTPPPPTEEAKLFMSAIVPTNYLMVVKILEIAGGAFLILGRTAPLGIVILMPVAVNIMLWDLLLAKTPGLGLVLVGLLVVLMVFYRSYFLPFLKPTAKMG